MLQKVESNEDKRKIIFKIISFVLLGHFQFQFRFNFNFKVKIKN